MAYKVNLCFLQLQKQFDTPTFTTCPCPLWEFPALAAMPAELLPVQKKTKKKKMHFTTSVYLAALLTSMCLQVYVSTTEGQKHFRTVRSMNKFSSICKNLHPYVTVSPLIFQDSCQKGTESGCSLVVF